MLEAARQGKVQVVFSQQQYDDKAVRLLAGALDAQIVEVDPYSVDVIGTMKQVAQALHG